MSAPDNPVVIRRSMLNIFSLNHLSLADFGNMYALLP